MSSDNDLLKALGEINDSMGIDSDFIKDRISRAICAVCRNTYGVEDPVVEFDDSGKLSVRIKKTVCEIPENNLQISVDDALKILPDASIGDEIEVPIDTKQFGRISAQTARNVIRQGIRDGEKERITKQLKCYENELVSAQIIKINRNGSMILKIGNSETTLPLSEANLISHRSESSFVKVFVKRIDIDGFKPIPIVSRSTAKLVEKLFETEVPEIKQGLISIESIAREAGIRTKISVKSNDPDIEAVGSCIGDKGARIKPIIEELGGEKIDVIQYYDDPIKYIKSALAPAIVTKIKVVSSDDKFLNECAVGVPSDQLSLAIGIKGQNVKLASKLTGWKLNICSDDEI